MYLLDKRTGAVHHSHALFLQRIIQKLSYTVRTNHNRTLVNPVQAFNDMQPLGIQILRDLLVMNQRTIGIQRCAVIFSISAYAISIARFTPKQNPADAASVTLLIPSPSILPPYP